MSVSSSAAQEYSRLLIEREMKIRPQKGAGEYNYYCIGKMRYFTGSRRRKRNSGSDRRQKASEEPVRSTFFSFIFVAQYSTIRPVARNGSIVHLASPHGLLTRDP